MTTDEKILEFINKDDLNNENLKDICDLIGIENLKQLLLYAGGGHIYIPQPDKFKVIALKNYLTINRNKISNQYKLAREFGVCTKIISKVMKEIDYHSDPDQIRLPL